MRTLLGRWVLITALLTTISSCHPAGVAQDAPITISGTIIDEDGQPAANIEVTWLKNEYDNLDLKQLGNRFKSYRQYRLLGQSGMSTVLTDDTGRFIFNLLGKDVNAAHSTNEKPVYANNYLLILQDDAQSDTNTDHDGTALALSNPHTFSVKDGTTWDIGTVALWRNNYVKQVITDDFSADRNHFIFSWDEIENQDYELFVVGAAEQLGWHQFMDGNSLTLSIDDLPQSLMDGLSLTVLTGNDNWTFRTNLTALENLDTITDLERNDNDVLTVNTDWHVTAANNADFADICSSLDTIYFHNNSLTEPCLFGENANTIGQFILFDFKKVATFNTLIIWDAAIHGGADTCLGIYAWDEKNDLTYVRNRWDNQYLIMEYCDLYYNENIFTHLTLEEPVSTRFLGLAIKKADEKFDEASPDYYFESLGELTILNN